MPSTTRPSTGRLAGLRCLVVGAGSGIGRATAERFAIEGARLIVADVDAESLDRLAADLRETTPSIDVRTVALDVRDDEHWRRAVELAEGEYGGIDAFVNCVGIADEKPLAEFDLDRFRRVFSVNVEGAALGTSHAIRSMTRSHEEGGARGAIVHVASYSGLHAMAGAAAYCSSKAALIQLCKVAALECAEAGHAIRVNCVVPSGVRTPMWESTPMWPEIADSDEWKSPRDGPGTKRFADPDEIAAAIFFLVSEDASYVNGTALRVDGGAGAS